MWSISQYRDMIEIFFPFIVVLFLALLIPLGMMIVSWFLGPRKKTPIKMQPYECGVPLTSPIVQGRLSIKFFIVAMIFLVFDIEIAFLYPWAVAFGSLGVLGIIEMGLFILVLLAGLVYAWKKGALEWE